MATSRLCSIPDCGKPHKAHSFCHAHYERLRKYGDAQGRGGIKTAQGEPERYYREVVLAYEGDECLTWPYAKSTYGYGKIWLNGRVQIVSRLVCEETHGAPPTPKHDAAHSCGKGHLACVTKRHMSWKTRAENIADTFLHGTHNRGERSGKVTITEAQARQILALKGTMSGRKIAKEVGTTLPTVVHILHGQSWRWLSGA